MYTLIMNGNPDRGGSAFESWLDDFVQGLEAKGHETARVDLRELDIKFCTGCWSCWWATPGKCVFRDDMVQIYPEMVRADLIVWASPLVLGNVSALTKTAQDRFIPLAHPYIEIVDGECHHRKRYEHNAKVGLVVAPTAQDGPEDLRIVRQFYERFSKNTRSSFTLFATIDTPVEEAINEALAG